MMRFNRSTIAVHGISLLVVIAGLFCSSVGAKGQERKAATPESAIDSPFEDEKIDARALVEALANRNPSPKLVGSRHQPIFDPKFDWKEDERVWDASKLLIRHAEAAWPELVRHLGDERYCITLKWWSGHTYTWTVGRMCAHIISENLSAGYYRTLMGPAGARNVYARNVHSRMSQPEITDDSETLKEWCQKRNKKELYELQIELCEWAIQELKKPDDRPLGSPLRVRAWIATIEADIEALRQSEMAVRYGGFTGEEAFPYSKEWADEFREEYRKKNQ